MFAAFGLFSVGLVLWLGFWLATVHTRTGDPSVDFPPWYTDPLDATWQQILESNTSADLGRRAVRPVKVCGVLAEQAYLASIVCPGDPPAAPFAAPFDVSSAVRESVPTPLGFRYVDRFDVPCPTGTVHLFLSPYQCRGEPTQQAPDGFAPRFPQEPR